MGNKSFKNIVKSEDSASSYLQKLCWKNYRRFCIRCHSYRLYKLADKKYRCTRCGYTFHDFSGRWISKCRIGSRNWLMIIRWFEEGFSAKQILKKIDLSYPTVLKALEVLRLSIIANQADAELWLDLVYYRPRLRTKQKERSPVVFGIIESEKLMRFEILEDLPMKSLLDLKPRMLCRSSIYYADEHPPYSFILFHDHKQIHDLHADSRPQIHSTNNESDFLRFARRLINRHRGITYMKFPQYLKEIEFRYNYRDHPIFKQLCHFLVSFVP
jgi:transposase